MNERKVFWFVLLMAAFVLVGVWRIAGGAGVLLAVGSVVFTSHTTTNVARPTRQRSGTHPK